LDNSCGRWKAYISGRHRFSVDKIICPDRRHRFSVDKIICPDRRHRFSVVFLFNPLKINKTGS
jgi:hypothetical protein